MSKIYMDADKVQELIESIGVCMAIPFRIAIELIFAKKLYKSNLSKGWKFVGLVMVIPNDIMATLYDSWKDFQRIYHAIKEKFTKKKLVKVK